MSGIETSYYRIGLQAHAQRLLLVGNSTPVLPPFTPALSHLTILPQNEQLATATEPEDTGIIFMNAAATAGQRLSVSNDVSEPVSVQASDDEVEAVVNERVMDFVACHGASPANVADHANDSSSTLAEIFRCFICLGKVCVFFSPPCLNAVPYFSQILQVLERCSLLKNPKISWLENDQFD